MWLTLTCQSYQERPDRHYCLDILLCQIPILSFVPSSLILWIASEILDSGICQVSEKNHFPSGISSEFLFNNVSLEFQ